MRQPIAGLKIPGWAGRLLATLIFAVLVVAGLEIAARVVLPDQVAVWRSKYVDQRLHRQVYFLTRDILRNRGTYPVYKPNSDLRILAYYPLAGGELTREYECKYRTDDLGFVSNRTAYEDSEILVVGDSFTAGSGGCDWVSDLAPNIGGRLYFAAHPGYGPTHWRNVVADLASTKPAGKLLIIFITEDLFRSNWTYSQDTLACSSRGRRCQDQMVLPINDDMDDVLAQRSAAYEPNNAKTFLKYHLIATLALSRMHREREKVDLAAFERSVSIIRGLAARHQVRLLWVSEKSEVDGPNEDTRMVAAALRGINPTPCPIPADGFLPRDNHPNARGYRVLRGCVEKVVENW